MLAAIGARMRTCTEPFAADGRDLGIGVCVDLLSHLACSNVREQANRAGWSEFRSPGPVIVTLH